MKNSKKKKKLTLCMGACSLLSNIASCQQMGLVVRHLMHKYHRPRKRKRPCSALHTSSNET